MSIVNLLPEDYIAHQAQKRANLMCLLLFVTVVIGLVAATAVSERKHKRTREVCERVNQSYDGAGKLIKQMQALDVTRHNMLKKANLTATLLERVPRSYLLAVITKALPKGASLTEFELRTRRAKASSVSPKSKSKYKKAAAKKKSASKKPAKMEVAIAITGLAGTNVQVGQFIATVEQCPLIKSVDFIFSKEKKVKESIMREFVIILYLKDSADVRGQSPDAEAAADTGGEDKRES